MDLVVFSLLRYESFLDSDCLSCNCQLNAFKSFCCLDIEIDV